MMPARTPSFPFPLLPFALAALGACSGPTKVEFGPARVVAKEQRPMVWSADQETRLGIQAMGPASAGMQGPQGKGAPGKVWVGDTPAGWEVAPANPSSFRDAVWRVTGQPDVEAWLTASTTGPVGTNLDRWYKEQFGATEVPKLEALPVADLAGKPGRLAEIKGAFRGRSGAPKAGFATLIVFTTDGGVVTSSLKMIGPEAVVLGKKDEFLALAKSLRTATASPDAKAPPIQPGQKMPEGHPPVGGGDDPHAGTGAPPVPAAKSPFTATAPAGWTAKAGSTKALHHTFGKDGEVYVSQLGGTLKSSLDIWRGEMGVQKPITDEEFAALPKIAFLGEDAVMLDLSGDMNGMVRQLKGARMLLAARIDGGTITFCKLAGPAADVAAQVDAFRAFCGSVRRAQ